MELGESCGRVVGKIEGSEVDRDATKRQTKSVNLDPWGLLKAKPFFQRANMGWTWAIAHM